MSLIFQKWQKLEQGKYNLSDIPIYVLKFCFVMFKETVYHTYSLREILNSKIL